MEAFLNKYRTTKGDGLKATHTGFDDDKGSYCIPAKRLNKFYSLILSAPRIYTIVECIPDKSSSAYKKLMLDFDFKQNVIMERIITSDDIDFIIGKVCNSLHALFNIKTLRMIAQQRDTGYIDGNIYKDGLHIICPDVCIKIEDQLILRDEFIKEWATTLFGDEYNAKAITQSSRNRFCNSYADIVDKSVITHNGWILQGCGKAKRSMYNTIVDAMLTVNGEDDIDIVDVKPMSPIDFIKLCSYADNAGTNKYEIKPMYKPKPDFDAEGKKGKQSKANVGLKPAHDNLSSEVTEILSYLLPFRKKAYDDWAPIAFCCKNIGLPTEQFLKWSQPEDVPKCVSFYEGIDAKQDGYNIFTLYRFLKEDNPKMHRQLSKKNVDIKQLLIEFDNYNLARLYYTNHPHSYIYHPETKWYKYEKNGLLTNTKSFPIDMHSNIVNFLQILIGDEMDKLIKGTDDYLKQIKEYNKKYQLAGSKKTIQDIMFFLDSFYHDPEINQKIDNNSNLLAFNNMILYDLSIKNFRKIEPTDYIMNSCGYSLDLKSNPAIRQEIRNMYLSIYDTEELVDYVLKTTALAFFGNHNEEFFVYTGRGGNGKGLLASMISKALGNYYYTLPSTFLQTKYKSDQANGALANCKGKRYVSLSEPDGESSFNIAFVKSLSGNDEITTRHLFGHPLTFDPQFTMFVQSNILPPIDQVDDGTIRRLRVVDHTFQFVNVVTDPATQRLRNTQLKKRVKQEEFVNEFMLYIFDIIRDMDTNASIIPPKVVSDATAEYLEENNPVKIWFYSTFEVTKNFENKSERIKSSDLEKEYNATTAKKITAKQFKKKMDEFGIPQKKISCMYYLGIRRIPNEEEEVNLSSKSESLI